jgi:hypothetical protein
MRNIFVLKKMARSVALASVMLFSAAGVAYAAGTGEQTGQYGDMSGHGKGSNAPEPRGYQESGGSTSGSGQGMSGQQKQGYDKSQDKTHNKRQDKSNDKSSGQGGGSSGQSGGGGY